ncbi:MAG: ectoine hydroxylase-related dioxygenase (phytanoyl-CoA dioxygenase family) [Parasphingorhabdus sp.]|jgi:ectoine hydroxylase-related dioxygenase (phytanoyl-CoA dioxygenase family)
MLFNENSMDWYIPGIGLDGSKVPDFMVDPADIMQYQADGALLLRGVFSEWVEPLRTGFQRNIDKPGDFAFACDSNPEGKPGKFFDSYCNWQRIPEYREFLQQSPAAAMAGKFMSSQSARFFHEHTFIKTAGTQHATPWHQDLPYYCVDGKQNVSVYVSLDHSPREVSVQFIKGSHKWQRLFNPRAFLDGSSFEQLETNDSNLHTEPSPDHLIKSGEYEILSWDLNPGDAILFDFRTLHGTTDAEVKSSRRAFSTRWLGDDITYCKRPIQTSPPYLNHGMTDGGTLREDWFPLVWQSR